ncbi:DMT family transporter [Sphingobacterium sp. LRF_L2]|uniref:DMT family transporter n=1 Tax=Sphingobacterium sp. LRF_L2 TaxID=3369421 RepID=UPI003F6133A1
MNTKSKAILLGLLSALFFAVTFILNRAMSLQGGSWIWSAAFRYYWMAILLLPLLLGGNKLRTLFQVMRKNLWAWILWSNIGFGVFYGGLTYAASFAPAWLVASTWQLTIIAGMCIAPYLGNKSDHKLSWKTVSFSLIILFGILLLQIPQAKNVSASELIRGTVPILLAAFAYPLGNRKMMLIIDGELSAIQRLFGMTLSSLPCWLILSVYGLSQEALPDSTIILQTFLVALSSGVVATWLFFKATDIVRNNGRNLAAVEATQSTEVIFALVGELVFLHAATPDALSFLGISIVIIGMILHSINPS